MEEIRVKTWQAPALKHINLDSIRTFQTMKDGEPAYDVSQIGEALGPLYYRLRGFDDSGVVYFDSVTNRRILSIGRHNETGDIIASTRADMYQNPQFECLWLY